MADTRLWDSCWTEGCVNKAEKGELFCFPCKAAIEDQRGAQAIQEGDYVSLEELKSNIAKA